MSDEPLNQSPAEPLALDAYQALAERYAANIDTKPHNAYYERPATLALLPDVNGQRVFDAGCGPGWYAEWLLDHGASVVGVDVSPNMIDFARQRTGNRADLRVASLDHPLDFAATGAFDLVLSSLVIHYVKNLAGLLAEFNRILRDGGLFVFSTGHPFGDFNYFKCTDYFATEEVGSNWRGFNNEPIYVPMIRYPLGVLTDMLWQAGFVIERLVEPLPTEEFKAADPEDYAKLMQFPGFMCVRARKDSTQRARKDVAAETRT